MTLRYSDSDETTDEEMSQLNLQNATHTYMMEQNAQDSITPVSFQDPKSPSQLTEVETKYIPDGQNTRLSQVAQKQLAHLLDESSGFRLQIPYLQQFFGTTWFLVHKDTFKLFAIYDTVFFETTCCAQSQPYNLVTLDENLQDLLQDRTRQINLKREQVMQISWEYTDWLAKAPVIKDFPHRVLSLQDRNWIHEDYIEATNFLGRLYRAHNELIVADPANCIICLQNRDEDLELVRKCFKRIKTFMISDNYFRSVADLPPAPYPDQQSSLSSLEQNSLDHLTNLAKLEVQSILRTLEQLGMYVDQRATLKQSSPLTRIRSKLNTPSAFCPVDRPSSSTQVPSMPQVMHSQEMALLETQSMQRTPVLRPTPVCIMDPAVAAVTNPTALSSVQCTHTPVSFASTTQVRVDVCSPAVNSVAPSTSKELVPISQNTGVSSTTRTQTTSQTQDHNTDPCRKCGKKNHKTDKCKKKTSCKKCKSSEHKTKFCTVDTVPDPVCTFCGKSRHTAKCCRVHKKAEKKARAQESGAARITMSKPSTAATQQTRGPPTSASGTEGSQSQGQQPTQVVPPLTIGERLQQLASSADGVTVSPPSGGTPPPAYMEGDRMDPG